MNLCCLQGFSGLSVLKLNLFAFRTFCMEWHSLQLPRNNKRATKTSKLNVKEVCKWTVKDQTFDGNFHTTLEVSTSWRAFFNVVFPRRPNPR